MKAFESIYARLQARATAENQAIGAARFAKLTRRQKQRGIYVCGDWQRLLNDYCSGKASHVDALHYLQFDQIEYAGRTL